MSKIVLPIFSKIWNIETAPKDWLRGVIITIGKNGDLSHCSNNRGITLNAVACKLYQIIILSRLSDGIEYLLRENQCGFRKGRSCADQLFTLRVMIDNVLDYNLPLVINFIDFKAAFDSVNREYIWTTLEHYGLPEKYIRVFKAFYTGTKSAVRIEGKLTEWLDVNLGTGQGGMQGPPIFNFQFRNPQKNIPDVDYADDIAALDDSEAGLQETTTLIARSASDANLKINVSKTKVMCINKHHVQPIHLIISEARLRYFGHAARMPESRFPRYLLTWKPKHGYRSAGRQRKTLMKCIIEDLDMFTESDGMTIEDGIKMAIERNNGRDWLRRSFRRLVENEQANPHG